MAAKAQTTRAKPVPAAKSAQEGAATELITEFAFGSDGLLYVNAEHLRPEQREGRAFFQGYAMTSEEARRALDAMHKVAFNVTLEAIHPQKDHKGTS